MKVECDDGLARDLFDFFSFTVPNAKFMPSVKNRYWDGKVRLFSIKTHKIYIGLLPYVDEFCRERGYDIVGINDIIGDKERQPDENFIQELGLPFEPRDYQLDAFRTAVQYGRQLLLSPTASGKSLIIYLLARYYNKKTVVIVPTTSLVEQMAKDFKDYGYDKEICKIYSGQMYLIQTSRLQHGSHLVRLLKMSWKNSRLSSETKHTSSKQMSSKESSKK